MTSGIAASLLVGVLGLTACGHEASSPPRPPRTSIDALTSALKDGEVMETERELTAKEAECLATVIHKSKLSDEALAGFVDGRSGGKLSEPDRVLIPKVTKQMTRECASRSIQSP